MEWEQKYPLATVNTLSREISDHTSLLLCTGEESQLKKQPVFKFELGCLWREDFFEIVAKVWSSENRVPTSLEKWQNKIRRLRQFLRGWAKDQKGTYKKDKQELLRKAEELDKKVRTSSLSQQELDLKQSIKDRLAHLLREEEIKWFQRAKTTKTLKGDRNTKYFQGVANGKRRKTRIFRLEQEEGVIQGNDNLKRYIQSTTRLFLDHLWKIIFP